MGCLKDDTGRRVIGAGGVGAGGVGGLLVCAGINDCALGLRGGVGLLLGCVEINDCTFDL